MNPSGRFPLSESKPLDVDDPTAPADRETPNTSASELDLEPQLEAMRTFLARYPSRFPTIESRINGPTRIEPHLAPSPVSGPTPVQATPAPRAENAPPLLREVPRDDARDDDARDTEASEPEPEPAMPRTLFQEQRHATRVVPFWRRHQRNAVLALLILVAVGLAAIAGLRFLPSLATEAPGTLTVGTNPAGVAVFVDGASHGVTPLNVNLPPGDHLIELVTSTGRRQIPVTLTAGNQVSQFLELPVAAASALGELQVRTEPSQALVTVDGQPVGRSPLSVANLAPGNHTVVLTHEAGTTTQQVLIENGRTTSLVVPITGSSKATSGGWISVRTPENVQVFENQRLLGNSTIDRIMLPVGRHELELVNDALGYREQRVVQVTPGQVAPVRIQWPQGSLALNAIPWADVWIDGARVGETPIGSLAVPIGTHEIIFRHPELGERRSSVTVTTGPPTRVGVDLRKK